MKGLRDLEVFVEVATLGGFHRAATQLHVAQSALSRRIANLEHEFGVPLLVRGRRGVTLTPYGALLLDRAQGLLRQYEQVRTEMLSEAGEPRGMLTIGWPPSLLTEATQVLSQLRTRFPHLSLKIWVATTVELRSMLLEGKLDLAVYASIDKDPRVDTISLRDDEIFLFGPAGSLTKSRTTWKEIAGFDIILPSRPNSVRRILDRASLRHGYKLNIVLEVNDVSLTLQLVEAGVGYAMLPSSALRAAGTRNITTSIVPGLNISWLVASLPDRPPSVSFTCALEAIETVFQRGKAD